MISFQEGLIFVYLFVVTWLLHELFHIKGQGIMKTGDIYVNELGFTASPYEAIRDMLWFKLSGGILASIVCFLVLFLSHPSSFSFGLITMGWMQLCYGVYEGLTPQNRELHRYCIYVGVTLFWIILWGL